MNDKMSSDDWWGLVLAIVLSFFGFIIIFVLIGLGEDFYCDRHPSYFDGDVCFRTNYRCQIECNNYGLNYTDFIEPCYCGCGQEYKVSICTGHKSLRTEG